MVRVSSSGFVHNTNVKGLINHQLWIVDFCKIKSNLFGWQNLFNLGGSLYSLSTFLFINVFYNFNIVLLVVFSLNSKTYAQAFRASWHLLPSKPHGGSLEGGTPRIHSISRSYRNSCNGKVTDVQHFNNTFSTDLGTIFTLWLKLLILVQKKEQSYFCTASSKIIN